MSENKYGYVVATFTEDGAAYLCERNGIRYFYSESGKRFSKETANRKAAEYVAETPGLGTDYGIRVLPMKRRTRGQHRRDVAIRLMIEREEAKEMARFEADMAGWHCGCGCK